jgi:hypothetical protein
MKDTVMAWQRAILKQMVWPNIAFLASMTINMMRGVYDVGLTIFLLSTSLLILLLSTLARDIRKHETAIGVAAFLSACLFAGNAGYIVFYDVPWLRSPSLGFVIFFLVMFCIPGILLLLPISRLHFGTS